MDRQPDYVYLLARKRPIETVVLGRVLEHSVRNSPHPGVLNGAFLDRTDWIRTEAEPVAVAKLRAMLPSGGEASGEASTLLDWFEEAQIK